MEGLRTLFSSPVSLSRMAARARLITSTDAGPDCERITAPTLIITGERGLDHVVPVDGSTAYVSRIRNAHAVVLERTGHLGTITRPEAFADIVREFITGNARLLTSALTISERAAAGRQPPFDVAQGGLEALEGPDRVA